jgi:hypothetical protein
MSLHETPQKRERQQKLKNLHSPPVATSTKKESKAEAERKDPAAR